MQAARSMASNKVADDESRTVANNARAMQDVLTRPPAGVPTAVVPPCIWRDC
jgi:hypothetical protein